LQQPIEATHTVQLMHLVLMHDTASNMYGR